MLWLRRVDNGKSMEIKCKGCNITKDETEYHLDRRRKNGRVSKCRVCISERNRRTYQLKNRNKIPHHETVLHECELCGDKKTRSEFRLYGIKKVRSDKCRECIEQPLFKDFEKWYEGYKDTDDMKRFLGRLRLVTGINGEEDLKIKYNIKDGL